MNSAGSETKPESPVERLLLIMRRLRDPDGGCPWDCRQDFDTIAPFTIEEAYEVADAIDRADLSALRGELGDLLFQVVFHARMAEETGAFDFNDVCEGICAKLIRRHPHVFAGQSMQSAQAQSRVWEAHKIAENRTKSDTSVLAGISPGLPEWMRALKIQRRAASVGFDWQAVEPVLDKVGEELRELTDDYHAGQGEERLLEEFGDLLFAACNVARHLNLDPGRALRVANTKFERRFRLLEQRAAARRLDLSEADPDTLDALWEEAKALLADPQRSPRETTD